MEFFYYYVVSGIGKSLYSVNTSVLLWLCYIYILCILSKYMFFYLDICTIPLLRLLLELTVVVVEVAGVLQDLSVTEVVIISGVAFSGIKIKIT